MPTTDCACVLHGQKYDWQYVERLYNMLDRHFTSGIKLHIWTESNRSLPSYMIHHPLEDWPDANQPRRGWWYKMQMFAPLEQNTRLFYFDLDTVIVGNLDWMLELDPHRFWAVRDFRYLWNPTRYTINSSIMIWDTQKFDHIWKGFTQRGISDIARRYPGDQDYLTRVVPNDSLGWLPEDRIRSWRWQVLDGGYDIRRRAYHNPGIGPRITEQDRVLIFHGDPKPDQVEHPVIEEHWR